MAIETNELIDVKELPPFKKFIMSIGAIPTSYLESMTYAELLMWFCDYLQNTVIPTINNNGQAVEELQNFVMHYFDNLDVQEEINKKLDEMANNGQLTNLIKQYIDPIIDEQNEDIETFKETINTQINNISTELESVASGSPLVASSTSEMTDTTRVYVNTTDGKWYYYDGDSWEIGGTYQATEDSNTVNELERVQNNLKDNLYNYLEDNKTIIWQIGGLTDGEIVSANDRIVTTNIEHNIYPIKVSSNDYSKFRFGIAYYESDGTYSSQTGWSYVDIIIPANSYYRIVAVRYSQWEDLRPIGVYNSDVYQSLKLKSNVNLSLLADIPDLQNTYNHNYPILNKYLKYDTGVMIQGLTKVNNDLWQFSASSNDHTSWYGQILQINENKEVSIKYHDFGHIPSVAYYKEKNMLIFGNGSTDTEVSGKLQFYKNLSEHQGNIYSVNDENYLEIDLSSLGSTAPATSYGLVCSKGESENIVYIFLNSNKHLYKCLIGYGTNDYSSEYGIYNYIDDNTINGTLHIINEKDLSSLLSGINDTIQTMYYLPNGDLSFLVGTRTTTIYRYRLNQNNDYILSNIYYGTNKDDTDTNINEEPQSILYDDNKLYISYKGSTYLLINTIII